jgi:outer membrane protein assembly factor BamD (BamD/ComL family)
MDGGKKRALKVFLCHASGDKQQVRVIYKRLITEGVDAWLDQEKLLPGQDWRVEIPHAVEESDVVLVCLSHNSLTKEGYIQKEIKFALDVADEKPDGTIFLIPARLEDCPVPEKFSRWQWVDLFEDNGYVKLLRSLKLRADRVGAVVVPLGYVDEDEEKQHRLEQYYTEGLAAFYTEDWDRACQRFQLILSESPNHANALEKLEEAERQRDLAGLYAQSMKAYQAEDWQGAIKTLDELLKKSPEYRDSVHLLKNARKQKQLIELYSEAKRLHVAGKWQAVLKVFDQILAIEPMYPDADGLLSSAKKEMVQAQKLAELNGLYSRALREMEVENWQEAKKMLEQVHQSQTRFMETERLLKKVVEEIAQEDELKHRRDEINTLYEQAHGLVRSKSWRNVLGKIEEIRKLDGQFEDKDEVEKKAKAALEIEDQKVREQNELAAMYAEAVRLMKEGKYQEALAKWNEVRAIDPKYPDRQWVQRIVQRKLSETGKSRLGFLRNRWFVTAILIFLAGIVIYPFINDEDPPVEPTVTITPTQHVSETATLTPSDVYVTRIEIPSNTNLGIQYQIPNTGFYKFRYIDSAYSAYDFNSSFLYIWNTKVHCYRGKSPFWSNGGLSEASLLFTIGSYEYSTRDSAIKATRGADERVYLIKDEWITFIVADGQNDYSDNSGEIILDVYYLSESK